MNNQQFQALTKKRWMTLIRLLNGQIQLINQYNKTAFQLPKMPEWSEISKLDLYAMDEPIYHTAFGSFHAKSRQCVECNEDGTFEKIDIHTTDLLYYLNQFDAIYQIQIIRGLDPKTMEPVATFKIRGLEKGELSAYRENDVLDEHFYKMNKSSYI